jgi:hypothetical protein
MRQRDLVNRSRRAVRWLQPGLVVKRWMLTSGIGLLLALLGAAVWADLQPIYWTLESIKWLLARVTQVMPRGITGPLVLVVGGALVWLGQSRTRCLWMPWWPSGGSTAAQTSWRLAAARDWPRC